MKNYTNTLARILVVSGVIYLVLSLFGSFMIGKELEEFGLGSRIEIVFISLVVNGLFTLLIIGVAEIIELLHKQDKNSKELISTINASNVNAGIRINQGVNSYDDLPEL